MTQICSCFAGCFTHACFPAPCARFGPWEYLRQLPPYPDSTYHRRPGLIVLTGSAGSEADVEFLRQLQAEGADIPAVVWADNISPEVLQRLAEAGAVRVLPRADDFDDNGSSCAWREKLTDRRDVFETFGLPFTFQRQSLRVRAVSAREANGNEAIILLIENDESDVFIFRRAMAKLDYPCRVFAVETLTQARAFLENTGRYSDQVYYRRPDLIVSDFKLTGETALDFLKWLRTQSGLASLPLVILSGVSTKPERSVFDGFEIKAFLAKTHDVTQLGAMLRPLLPQVRAQE